MTQYRDLHYEDSDDLNQFSTPGNNKDTPIDPEYEENLLKQLQEGKITETQYNTLTKTNQKHESDIDENGFLIELGNIEVAPSDQDQPSEPQEQTPQYQFDPNY